MRLGQGGAERDGYLAFPGAFMVGPYSCLGFDRPFPTEYGPNSLFISNLLTFYRIGARHPSTRLFVQ